MLFMQTVMSLLAMPEYLSTPVFNPALQVLLQSSMETGNGFCTASCIIILPALLNLIVPIKGRRGIAKCRMQAWLSDLIKSVVMEIKFVISLGCRTTELKRRNPDNPTPAPNIFKPLSCFVRTAKN